MKKTTLFIGAATLVGLATNALRDAPNKAAAYDLIKGIWEKYNQLNEEQTANDNIPF